MQLLVLQLVVLLPVGGSPLALWASLNEMQLERVPDMTAQAICQGLPAQSLVVLVVGER